MYNGNMPYFFWQHELYVGCCFAVSTASSLGLLHYRLIANVKLVALHICEPDIVLTTRQFTVKIQQK